MKTIWKKVPNYRLYEVSNNGKVRSYSDRHGGIKKEPHLLKPSTDKDGYKKVVLYKNGKRKYTGIHRLMCMAFIPNPENKPQVNHINGIKADNRLFNLEWCTLSENRLHSYALGLECQKGEKNAASKLTREDVLDIRNAYRLGCFSHSDIAKAYKTSQSNITLIINRKRWAHI